MLPGASSALTGAAALVAVQWRPCEAKPALEVAARKPQSKRAFPVGVSAVCQHWSMIPGEVQGILFLLVSLVPSWEDLIQLVLCSTDPVLGSSTAPGLGPPLLSWRVPAVSAEVPRLAQRQGLLWGILLWPSAPLCAGIQDHCDPAGLQAGGGGPRHGGAAGTQPMAALAGCARPSWAQSLLWRWGKAFPAASRNCLRQPQFCPRQSCGLSPWCPCFSASLQQLGEQGQPC